MKKPIIEYIDDDIYRHQLLFISGCPLSEAKKELKKYHINLVAPEVEAKGIMCAFDQREFPRMKSGTALFMWIEKKKDFYTLLHETTHLCIKIFDLSNMSVDLNTTEAFAFYHEFWFKKLWRLMSKK